MQLQRKIKAETIGGPEKNTDPQPVPENKPETETTPKEEKV
jgi:hypothetical protein